MPFRPLLVTVALLLAASAARADSTYNFAVANGGWSTVQVSGVPNAAAWQYGNNPAPPGGGNAWFTPGQADTGAHALTSPSNVLFVNVNGQVTGSFTHRYQFDRNNGQTAFYDGGQLQFRLNGGAWNAVPQNLITGATYTQTIDGGVDGGATIQNQRAFADQSPNFGTSYVTSNFTLGTGTAPFLTGTASNFVFNDLVEIRFLGGWGLSVVRASPNWQIGSVTVVNAAPEPGSLLAVAGLALGGVGAWRRRTRRAAVTAR